MSGVQIIKWLAVTVILLGLFALRILRFKKKRNGSGSIEPLPTERIIPAVICPKCTALAMLNFTMAEDTTYLHDYICEACGFKFDQAIGETSSPPSMKRRVNRMVSKELWADPQALAAEVRHWAERECRNIGCIIAPGSDISCIRTGWIRAITEMEIADADVDFRIAVIFRCIPASAIKDSSSDLAPSVNVQDAPGWEEEVSCP